MIDTTFFLLQFIGILVLLGWTVYHDRQKEGAPTRGPLAFKQKGAPKQETAPGGGRLRKRKARAGLTRHRGRATLESWRL